MTAILQSWKHLKRYLKRVSINYFVLPAGDTPAVVRGKMTFLQTLY
jgi:hypothetical protein